jgi:hypothetical protein
MGMFVFVFVSVVMGMAMDMVVMVIVIMGMMMRHNPFLLVSCFRPVYAGYPVFVKYRKQGHRESVNIPLLPPTLTLPHPGGGKKWWPWPSLHGWPHKLVALTQPATRKRE